MATVLIHGEEKYQLARVRANKKANLDEFTYAEFDDFGDEAKEECDTLSFLGEKLVICEGTFRQLMTSQLSDYLSNENERTNLILIVTNTIDKRNKVFKNLTCKIKEYKKFPKEQVISHILKQLTTTEVIANYLYERLDYEDENVTFFEVDNAVSMLSNASVDVSMELIDDLFPKSAKANVFSMINAIFAGDKDAAHALSFAEKSINPAFGTFSLILSTLSLMYKISLSATSSELGISPFRYRKVSDNIAKMDSGEILKLLETGMDIRLAALTGKLSYEDVVFEFIERT